MTIDLLNIDCMEFMATLHDNEVDLAIVDPEYGIGINKAGYIGAQKRKVKQKNGSVLIVGSDRYHTFDDKRPNLEYFTQLFRVSKNQIIWGGNHLADLIAKPSPCWIVWDKLNTGNFADCELAYTSFKTATRKFSYQWNGMLQGKHGDKRKNESRIHPTQKPVCLYSWLLENYAIPGQKILDTHLGSGSSSIAAHYFQCDFVGCEIDPVYYQSAKNRFEQETRQKAMF